MLLDDHDTAVSVANELSRRVSVVVRPLSAHDAEILRGRVGAVA